MISAGLDVVREGACLSLRLSGEPLCSQEAVQLCDAIGEAADDRDVRIVALSSRGADFCPGAAPDLSPERWGEDPAGLLGELDAPVVAALNGRAASVGFELALAADIRLAATGAILSLTDVASGRLPSWGGTQRLPRLASPGAANAMLLLARQLTAEEALAAGLLYRTGEDAGALLAEVVDQLLAMAPLALRYAKEAIRDGYEMPMRDGMRLEADLNALLQFSHDRAQGLAAFQEKRTPEFEGR